MERCKSRSGTPQRHVEGATSATVISLDTTKAGMQSVDKARIEAIIESASRGSTFYVNEQRKAAQRQKRVEAMLEKSRLYTANILSNPARLRELEGKVRHLEAEIETTRDLTRTFVHMDMDMFYAAVEEKKDPTLRTVPLGVGSHAMLSTTNYVARQYGVRAGMPGFIGKTLCPALVILPTDFDAYRAEAAQVRAIAREYDPNFLSASLDELSLDLTECITKRHPELSAVPPSDAEAWRKRQLQRYAAAEAIVQECRARVYEATQLTISAGIAPTEMLAKVASNYHKPNGQHTLVLLSAEEVKALVQTWPLRRVPGIGKSFEAILNGIGIESVADIYADRLRLSYLITPKSFRFIFSSSLGIGAWDGWYDAARQQRQSDDPLDPGRKSIGQERTFSQPHNRLELQEIAYQNLTDAHAAMTKRQLLTEQVVLKLKHRSFQVRQVSARLPTPTDDVELLRRALDGLLLPHLEDYAHYRLLGVRLEKLLTSEELRLREAGAPRQVTLTDLFQRQKPPLKHRHNRRRPREECSDVVDVDDVVVVSSDSQLEVVWDDADGVAEDEASVKKQQRRENLYSADDEDDEEADEDVVVIVDDD